MKDPWVFVVNEAMYFGKPVIATNAVGSAFDMIKNGKNGFIVPEKETTPLCDAMKKILENPDLEVRMQEESKRILFENFNYQNMVEAFNAAISSIK